MQCKKRREWCELYIYYEPTSCVMDDRGMKQYTEGGAAGDPVRFDSLVRCEVQAQLPVCFEEALSGE